MRAIRSLALISTVCVALVTSLDGAAQQWFGGEGNWDVKENWIPNQVPTPSTGVEIDGTARILGVSAGSFVANLGYHADAGGTVEVKLEDGRWVNSSTIYVGSAERSTGRILVELGGDAATNGAILGFGLESSGELQVAGAGSTFSTSGMMVGDRSDGTVRIADGARLESTGTVYFAFHGGTIGEATITGAGSLMQASDLVVVGYAGEGTVLVERGAGVTSGAVIVGGGIAQSETLGGRGRLTITGRNSSWTSSARIVVGSTSTVASGPSDGVLAVRDGAKFSAAGPAIIGASGLGSVVVEGAGSEWSAGGTSDSFIGQDWQGSFFVFDGGKATLNSPQIILGNSSSSTGELRVAGPGSSFSTTGTLIVGINGPARLTVQNGGKVTAARISVRGQDIQTGSFVPNVIELTGGDTAQSRAVLETGQVENSSGDIKFDGGVLRATASQFSFVQPATGRPMPIGVHGAFVDTNGFEIGLQRPFSGAGGLTKQGLGTLTLMAFPSTYLGATVVEQGTLLVATPFPTVVNNFLPTGTALIIGNADDIGTAAFNLNGVVQQVGSLSSVGTRMSRAVTNTSATHTTLTVNQSVDTTFAGQLAGNLSVRKLGEGMLSLTGTNTHSGLTLVSGGRLRVDGSIAGPVTVTSGAVLLGKGSLGRVTVQDGGTFSPGGSPGVLTVSGGLVLDAGSIYLVELDGPAAGSQYDQTIVFGTVDLADAVLSLSLGFAPLGGQLFTIIRNDGTDPVIGSFVGLAEGATFTAEDQPLTISYRGGTGNDVVLSSAAPVPEPTTLLASALGLLFVAGFARKRHRRPASRAAVP